jgi:hypothetical protein
MNLNKLRQLYDKGLITEADLAGRISGSFESPKNALKQYAEPTLVDSLRDATRDTDNFGKSVYDALYDEKTGRFRSGGAIRDEQTGKVTVFGSPESQPSRVRVVGVGSSGVTDLGEEKANDFQLDMSRPAIEIGGLGKGYYTKDGRSAIIQNADGSKTRAILGFDREATNRNRMMDMKMREGEADIAYKQARMAEMLAPRADGDRKLSLTEVVDPSDPTRLLRIDANTYRGGSVGSPGVIGASGKEPVAAKREEKAAEGKDLLAAGLDRMRQNYMLLNERDGIVSNQRSGPENVVSAIRSSALGQFVGGVVGTEEQTARKELDASRMQLLNAIKSATGMSAQQMNSNIELQTWLKALGAPNSDYESNMAILDALENAYVKGTGKRQSAGPMKISSDAEYASLPSGATFIAPDGSTRRKP